MRITMKMSHKVNEVYPPPMAALNEAHRLININVHSKGENLGYHRFKYSGQLVLIIKFVTKYNVITPIR
jgi:hypothetical protein